MRQSVHRNKGFILMLLPEYFECAKILNVQRADLNMHRISSKHFENKNDNLKDFCA